MIHLSKYSFKCDKPGDKITFVPGQAFTISGPTSQPRHGWEEAFKEMNKQGDDQLLIDDVFMDESLN